MTRPAHIATGSIVLSPPDARRVRNRTTVPLWRCPNCKRLRTLGEFGLRCQRKSRFHRQSWCEHCR